MENKWCLVLICIILVACIPTKSVLLPTKEVPLHVSTPTKFSESSSKETKTPDLGQALINSIKKTPQPTQINDNHTATIDKIQKPTATATLMQNEFPSLNMIFAWQPSSQNHSNYGFFNPNDGGVSTWNYLTPSTDSSADHSVSLAFSHYSQQIAYLIWNNKAELWISDVDQQKPQRVWIDENKWLGEIRNFLDVRIVWGVADRYVILIPNFIENRTAIYDVKTRVMKKWKGNCDIAAESPLTGNINIWCSSDEENQRKSYAVLDEQGIGITPKIPNVISNVIDWVYSSDGERLLFATNNLDVFIASKTSLLKLSAKYESSEFYDIMLHQNLQWSYDGKNALVYAYGEPKSLCPQWKKDINANKLEDRPCWLVIDTSTGEIVWNPSIRIPQLDIPWEYLSIVHDATISDNGKWLAMILTDIRPGRDFILYITSIDNTRGKTIPIDEAIYLKWQLGK